MGLDPATISADFPWGRLFEIDAMVSPTPKYTVYLTAAEKQRRAEEAAKKAAEEAAKKKAAEEAAKKKAAAQAFGKSDAGITPEQPAPQISSNEAESDDVSTVIIHK